MVSREDGIGVEYIVSTRDGKMVLISKRSIDERTVQVNN
jgi:hypothetical protein